MGFERNQHRFESHRIERDLRGPLQIGSVCSVCAPLRTAPKHRVKTGYSQSPERGAGNAIFFVSNLLSSSQAGRRRFDPGLPLHFSRTWKLPLPPELCSNTVYNRSGLRHWKQVAISCELRSTIVTIASPSYVFVKHLPAVIRHMTASVAGTLTPAISRYIGIWAGVGRPQSFAAYSAQQQFPRQLQVRLRHKAQAL